ncbi:hypothetical protein CTEN210_17004 [Chaetoceros tenuissimus]|uniref:Uncharacterized protein n=1 Tax=Chaetoceros tenuissimus TaxID=426638 RepID=A0AAD3HEZ0_9STRA|nr:hypothetical protein CTEN210_17004 [Chaetoceros tenuissimus]
MQVYKSRMAKAYSYSFENGGNSPSLQSHTFMKFFLFILLLLCVANDVSALSFASQSKLNNHQLARQHLSLDRSRHRSLPKTGLFYREAGGASATKNPDIKDMVKLIDNIRKNLEEKNESLKQNPTVQKMSTTYPVWKVNHVRRQLSDRFMGNGNRKKLRQNAFVIICGLCLTFNAGYINGCCLSGVLTEGVGVGVAAHTGAWTNAGLKLGAGNLFACSQHLKMIASFAFGALLSGFMNPYPSPNKLSPQYGPSFLLGSLLMTTSSFLAFFSPQSRAFLYFAAMANGIQNGISSAYSANLVRSTHMSGTTSDIGMLLGQILRGNMENAWRFMVLCGLATSFFLGGAVSFVAVTKFKSLALAFNATFFYLIALAINVYTSYQAQVSVWKAWTGRWEWHDDEPSYQLLSELFDRHCYETGLLDKDGFRNLLNDAGVKKMSDVGLSAIFKSLDLNKDDRISKIEMMRLLSFKNS